MGVKSDYLKSLRNTPDGIAEFCDWAIPTLVATTEPTGDAATCQEILAHNLNTIFVSLEGWKPIETMLRIVQHNNVAEAMLLSCLEYFGNTQQEFAVLEPTAGGKYAPGDLRIVVSAKSSKIATVDVSLTHGASYDTISLRPNDTGSLWYGYAIMGFDEEIIDALFDFSVVFADENGTTKTASVALTIESDGYASADIAELENAKVRALAATEGLIRAWSPIDLIGGTMGSITKKIAVHFASDVLESAAVALIEAIKKI